MLDDVIVQGIENAKQVYNMYVSTCILLLEGKGHCRIFRSSKFGNFQRWERSGSVVECLTRDREAAGSSLTGVTALWSLSKTHLS